MLLPTAEAARSVPRGDLELVACLSCGFLSNAAFDPTLMAYGDEYENDQTFSAEFDAYVDGLVAGMVESGVRNQRVVEIGCGTGYFLRRLCLRGANTGFGYDEAYRGPDHELEGRLSFVAKRFDAHTAPGADVILCRHVIEHVPDPVALLRSVEEGRGPGVPARVFFETLDLEWILDLRVVQDFFYEHCSYFSGLALRAAFERANITPVALRHVFNDQYLWLEGRTDGGREPAPAAPASLVEKLRSYPGEERQLVLRLREELHRLRRDGAVAVWGAGAKGVTFLNLVDPDAELVAAVIDINPRKQRCFVAGTGHPIEPPSSLATRRVRNVVVMNENYMREIDRLVAELGVRLHLHPWHL